MFTNFNYQRSAGCYVTLNTTLQQPLVIVLSQLGVECNEGLQYQISSPSTKPSRANTYCQQTENGETYTYYRIYNPFNTPYVQMTIWPKDDTQINVTITGNVIAVLDPNITKFFSNFIYRKLIKIDSKLTLKMSTKCNYHNEIGQWRILWGG